MTKSLITISHQAVELGRAYLPYIKEINQILFNHFNIFLLTYRRFYFNGKMLYLFGHEEWMETCFEKYYMTSHSFISRWQEINNCPDYKFIFPEKLEEAPNPQDPVYNGLQQRGLWHGAIIYKNRGDCLDAYCFLTEANNSSVRDIYHNHPEVLDDFINHLMVKINPLLRSFSPYELISFNLPKNNPNNEMQAKIEAFKKYLNTPKHYIRLNQQDILLSEQQFHCYCLQGSGFTQKQIAQELGIGYRAVETHLKRIREKANINFNSELSITWRNQKFPQKK